MSAIETPIRPTEKSRPKSEGGLDFAGWIGLLFFYGPVFLLLVAVWVAFGGFTIWYLGTETYKSMMTGTISDGILGMIKVVAYPLSAVGAVVGVAKVWSEGPKGVKKIVAIAISAALFLGVFGVHHWCTTGPGAVEDSENSD